MTDEAKIDYKLFWSLPGPQSFVDRIAADCRETRGTLVHFPISSATGTWDAVMQGLEAAQFQRSRIISVRIDAGTDIGMTVAHHFDRKRIAPGELAQLNTGTPSAVVLQPVNEIATNRCEEYFKEFAIVGASSIGDVHLITRAPVESPNRNGTIKEHGIQVIVFDSALTADEMNAYVSIRMLKNPGLGKTRLLKSLVCEFAGYDAWLAEQLIGLDTQTLMNLPASLGPIVSMSPERWSRAHWRDGTSSTINGHRELHPLYEWYVANHVGPESEKMSKALSHRYWKACLRSLSPYIEERRAKMLRALDEPLEVIARANKGLIPRPRGTQTDLVPKSEVEFGNIVGMHFSRQILVPMDPLSQAALRACHVVKPVRDAIAHNRPPKSDDIVSLVTAFDDFEVEYNKTH